VFEIVFIENVQAKTFHSICNLFSGFTTFMFELSSQLIR